MTEHDIALAKQAGAIIHDMSLAHESIRKNSYLFPTDFHLNQFIELIRAEKPLGEANPVACMFINYDGECEEIGHLDNYNGQVPDEFTPLFTYQPDQSAKIARLERIIKDQRLLFDAREAGLEKIIREFKENT
jgi:hypothetical protein